MTKFKFFVYKSNSLHRTLAKHMGGIYVVEWCYNHNKTSIGIRNKSSFEIIRHCKQYGVQNNMTTCWICNSQLPTANSTWFSMPSTWYIELHRLQRCHTLKISTYLGALMEFNYSEYFMKSARMKGDHTRPPSVKDICATLLEHDGGSKILVTNTYLPYKWGPMLVPCIR